MTEQVPPTGVREPTQTSNDGGRHRRARRRPGYLPWTRCCADVDRLDDVPLEEHLGPFERAHESLRAALDDAARADRPADPA